VLSLPVLRLGGVWTAIATLAFAYFFDAVAIKFSWVGGGGTSLLQGTRVPRPVLGPWNFTDDRSFLVLSLIVFALVSLVVIQIRSGTLGRTLRALRGSEVAAQSIGISPAKARMTAFAISAFIAGLGGAMLSIQQTNVNYNNNFGPFSALFWLVLVVSMGSRTVEGAVQAGTAFAMFDTLILRGTFLGWILRSSKRIPGIFPVSPKWRFVFFGVGTLQFARHPEGMVQYSKSRVASLLRPRAARGVDEPEAEPEARPDVVAT
jgi:ABC-type branched-subunit amino acid transport system permease subunit